MNEQYLLGTLNPVGDQGKFQNTWLFDDDHLGAVEVHCEESLEHYVGQRLTLRIFAEAKALVGPGLRTRRFHVAIEKHEAGVNS